MTLIPFPLRTPPAIFLFVVSLAAIGSGLESEPVRAEDESGGWDVFQTGFATKARVAAGTPVTVNVLAMGNGRTWRKSSRPVKYRLRSGGTSKSRVGETNSVNAIRPDSSVVGPTEDFHRRGPGDASVPSPSTHRGRGEASRAGP